MKTKEELKSMLFSRLAELQDGRLIKNNPTLAVKKNTELQLLYEIFGEEVLEEYREQIGKMDSIMSNVEEGFGPGFCDYCQHQTWDPIRRCHGCIKGAALGDEKFDLAKCVQNYQYKN